MQNEKNKSNNSKVNKEFIDKKDTFFMQNEKNKIKKSNNLKVNKDLIDKEIPVNSNKKDLFFFIGLYLSIHFIKGLINILYFIRHRKYYLILLDLGCRLAINILLRIVWTIIFTIYFQVFTDKFLANGEDTKFLFLSYSIVIGFFMAYIYRLVCVLAHIMPDHGEQQRDIHKTLLITMKVTIVLLVITMSPVIIDILLRFHIKKEFRSIFYLMLCTLPFGIPVAYFSLKRFFRLINRSFNSFYDYLYLIENKIENIKEE
ncbi:hypothetical protein GVAV_002309 [Gurleya vavrai]